MSKLLLKRNSLSGVAPALAELDVGELALNTFDGRLFTKINQGGAESIITIGGDSSTTGVLYVSKNGNDANSGLSENSAKATIKAAIETASQNIFTPIITPGNGFVSAYELIKLNKPFIQAEVVAFVNDIFSSLVYDQEKCARDVGLIIDAITHDLYYGGNEETLFATRSYYTYLGTEITGQTSQTASAIGYAKTISRQIMRNITIPFTYQEAVSQIINLDYANGNDANTRIIELFNIVENGITNGELDLPALVETQAYITYYTIRVASGEYIEQNPIEMSPFTAIVGDSLRTVTVKPLNNTEDLFHVTHGDYLSDMTFEGHLAPSAAVAFAPAGNTFLQRSIEAWRSPYIQNCTSKTTTGTGMRVDGSVAGGLRSMVVDSYTQYNQGGIGVHLLNRGYAQLVSVFTICCQDAFLAESGGFCSITNSNSSFGTYGLRSTGVSEANYSGETTSVSDQSGRNIIVDGLIIRPNVGDAVKFTSDDFYYTVQSATSLFTTQNTGSYLSASALLTVNKNYIAAQVVSYINSTYPALVYDSAKAERDTKYIIEAIASDLVTGGVEKSDAAGRSYWSGTRSVIAGIAAETLDSLTHLSTVATNVLAQTAPGQILDGNLTAETGTNTIVAGLITDIKHAIARDTTGTSTITLEETVVTPVANNVVTTFHQRSLISSSSHTFEYIGTGNNIESALPYTGGIPIQENEIIEDDNGAGRVNFTSTDQRGDFRIGEELVIERATGTISGRTFNRSLFAVMTPYILAIGE